MSRISLWFLRKQWVFAFLYFRADLIEGTVHLWRARSFELFATAFLFEFIHLFIRKRFETSSHFDLEDAHPIYGVDNLPG